MLCRKDSDSGLWHQQLAKNRDGIGKLKIICSPLCRFIVHVMVHTVFGNLGFGVSLGWNKIGSNYLFWNPGYDEFHSSMYLRQTTKTRLQNALNRPVVPEEWARLTTTPTLLALQNLCYPRGKVGSTLALIFLCHLNPTDPTTWVQW
jgi:hypothetical protein